MRWQEARVSRAVDLMVAHVENLRRRHDRSAAELEEARRVIQQQNSCRGTGDPRASPGLSICVHSWSCLVFSHLGVWLITLCCCCCCFFFEKIQTTVTADLEATCRFARTELVTPSPAPAPVLLEIRWKFCFICFRTTIVGGSAYRSFPANLRCFFFSLYKRSLLLAFAQNIHSCS